MSEVNLDKMEMSDLLVSVCNQWNSEVAYIEQLEDMVDDLQVKYDQQLSVINNLKSQPKPVGGVDPAEVKKYERKITNLENQELALQSQIKRVEGALSKYQRLYEKQIEATKDLEKQNQLLIAKVSEVNVANVQLKHKLDQANKVEPVQEDPAQVKKLKTANAKHEKTISQLKKDLNTSQQQVANLSKDDPVALSKKVTNLQKRNRELLDSKELLIKENREYRLERDAALKEFKEASTKLVYSEELVTRLKYREKIGYSKAIYLDDNSIIALLPQRFRVNVDGKQGLVEQHHLLYSDRRGIWKQISLDGDGELSVARPYCAGYSERTEKLVQKVLPNPNEDEIKFMKDWLTQLGKNDWQVTDLDVFSLQEGRMLSVEEAYELSLEGN